MATYAIQFITKEGAFCGQTITNRARALLLVGETVWLHIGCVVIVVTANSSMERLRMRATAVSQVFHEQGRAMTWLKNLLAEEEQS